MNLEQILLIFIKKKLKCVIFFETNPNFIKLFMIFLKKKHEFGTNSIDFLEIKTEKCDFFRKKS